MNDTYGHDTGGDYVLKRVAGLIQERLRDQDVLSRWGGGEEFLIMLPETGIEDAVVVAEKLRVAIETARMEFGEHHFSITMTIGVATYEKDLGIEKSIKKS